MVAIAAANVPQAEAIPYVTADEAYALLQVQLERLLALLETLNAADWNQPTACTLWNVRDMLAHQVGGYASGTGYAEMIRQYTRIPAPGQLPEDAINAYQLRQRAGRSPAQLIADLRAAGPLASRNWAYGFHLAKLLAIPHPIAGILTVRHLMLVIHSRDTWMHRLDICRATGRAFEQTAQQEGRIVALVMLDLAKRLRPRLGGQAVRFELAGVAGGAWQVGAGQPAAAIHMDALDFSIYVSGRYRFDEARARAEFSGDAGLAEKALRQSAVLF